MGTGVRNKVKRDMFGPYQSPFLEQPTYSDVINAAAAKRLGPIELIESLTDRHPADLLGCDPARLAEALALAAALLVFLQFYCALTSECARIRATRDHKWHGGDWWLRVTREQCQPVKCEEMC